MQAGRSAKTICITGIGGFIGRRVAQLARERGMSVRGLDANPERARLAQDEGAINLGQGFPDGNGPPDVVEAAVDYLKNGLNQYPPMMGLPALRQAVARANKRFYGLDVDWQTEVMVTSGATEALAVGLFGMIEPGDEVILIEPLYDCYLPIVQRAGGVPGGSAGRDPDRLG